MDLKSLPDLVLPADLNNPNDPRVFVVDPNSPEAWKTQVRLLCCVKSVVKRCSVLHQ